MNEELQKALAEFVRATMEGFKTGKDFVVAEAPDVIQQLIRWNFWSSVFWAVICTLLAFAVWRFLFVRFVKTYQAIQGDKYESRSQRENYAAAIVCSAVVAIALTCFALYHTQEALQIYIAPKVWLIEWAMAMLSTTTGAK